MSTPEPAAAQPASPLPLADWGTRVIGAIIDWAPVGIVNAIFFQVDVFNVLLSLAGLAYWAYMGHMEGVTGQTPGKAMMGIRLVNERGELVGSGAGIGRKFLHVLDFICFLGFLLPLIDSKKQTIADKLMQTYVVTGVEKKPFAVDLWSPPKTS